MAIQTVKTGAAVNDGTGDDARTAFTKINQNFTDSANAASRLVGVEKTNVPVNENILEVFNRGFPSSYQKITYGSDDDLNNAPDYSVVTVKSNSVNSPINTFGVATDLFLASTVRTVGGYKYQEAVSAYTGERQWRAYQNGYAGLQWTPWRRVWSTANTTVDSNKNIKSSSPVVRVFSDHLDKIHEANQLPIKYTRNGVGDYTIEGTTGLCENDWQIVIPEDDHRNQLIAFTIEDDNGTIRLKTYKRTFIMETFTFGPDLKTPLDIPEGRWVDLHFNDIPQE